MMSIIIFSANAQAQDDGSAEYRKGLREGYKTITSDSILGYYDVACPYFWRAALKGNARGMDEVGECYDERDIKTAANIASALHWYKKAAELGNTRAMIHVGNYYKRGFMGYLNGGTGNSKTEDFEGAKQWYLKAGEAGDARGYFEIAYMYDGGELVKRDSAETVRWYKKSAAMGNINPSPARKSWLERMGRVLVRFLSFFGVPPGWLLRLILIAIFIGYLVIQAIIKWNTKLLVG